MPRVFAVDLGGTKIAAAVVSHDGRILARRKQPVDAARTVEQIRSLFAELAGGEITAAGVTVPGIYYAASGKAWAPNLWGPDSVPLRDRLQDALPAPVMIDSDRAACVLGEHWLGAARGCSDVVFLAVGTGIGAGILAGGRLVRGAGDIAGAVGWFALNPRKKPGYKQRGCFEDEAAGPALGRRLGLPAETAVEAARRGDPAAQFAVQAATRYLAMGVANLISALNPEIVVLGGGLMQAGDLFLAPLRREVAEWAQPHAARQARIELTQLGEDAALLGAARLAFECCRL